MLIKAELDSFGADDFWPWQLNLGFLEDFCARICTVCWPAEAHCMTAVCMIDRGHKYSPGTVGVLSMHWLQFRSDCRNGGPETQLTS